MTDLKILFIEDFENDVLLLLHELQRAGYEVQWQRVDTSHALKSALTAQPWDLILCDYSMPSLKTTEALEIMRRHDLDLPFIIVSGSINEEEAISALQAGAHDFLSKNNLARLLPAVRRELLQAENRRKRRQLDDSLRASELRFRNTIENMMEGCQILGHDWRYLYLNAAAEKHNHRPNDELLGRVYMEMWPGIESTAVFKALQRCMQERTASHMTNEFIYPDGTKGWFELQIQPVPEGIFILSSDITDYKHAEKALLEREMKLTMLFEILPVGISILDAERKVTYTNPAMKRILDISEEQLLRGDYNNRRYIREDGSAIPPDEMPSVHVLREKKGIHDFEIGVVKDDESVVWTSVSAVPVDFPDWKVVVVTSDITERKQAEMEILTLNAELENKVAERTAELARANEQLYQLSIFDEMTGLHNRRGFLLLAEQQLLNARRSGRNLLVFYGDLDRLKQINDHNGHIAGDQAIMSAARALQKTFRTSDIKARLGGDEFIVLAVEAEGCNVVTLLTRLHECLAENGQSMSVGVVTWNAQMDVSMDDLIARADEAMYLEKRKKPGRFAA
jgi:diguanylate cyclase (GGDEF)-like protein/PAS domain S-box-containing protein